MAGSRPMRSSMLACFSQSAVNRRTSVSSWDGRRGHGRAGGRRRRRRRRTAAPSRRRAEPSLRAIGRRLTSSSRAKVPARLASSTMTSWPGAGAGGRWRRRASASGAAGAGRLRRPGRGVGPAGGRGGRGAAVSAGIAPAFGEPFGGVLGVDAELVGEDLGRRRGGGEAEYRAGAVLGFPGGAKAGHGGGLPGAGGTDQHVEPAARGGDLLDGEGLVVARA